MTNTHKSTRSTKGAAEKAEVVDTFIPLYTKNVERVAELQKRTLKIAAEQSTEFMDLWKKSLRMAPSTPGLFMFDLLGQTFERYVETQEEVVDLAVEQGHALAKLAQERGNAVSKIVDGMTTMFQQTVEHSVALQKKTLDHYAEQHKSAYETAKKQFRMASNPGAEAFQTGLDALIETQKVILDMASKPLRHAAGA